MSKKLYLSLSFQIILSEHFEITQQKGPLFSYFNFHSRWINNFMPTDSSNIEHHIYVPLNHKEGKHWILLVIDTVERRNYVLDSFSVNDEPVGMFGCHDSLGRLFKDVVDFAIDFLELPIQPNPDDCDMYILKYIEVDKKVIGQRFFYGKTEEIGVERLKSLTRLVTSNRNEFDFFKSIVYEKTLITLKTLCEILYFHCSTLQIFIVQVGKENAA
ncbi:hypothetical protein GQ457_17G011690 [Hibiscus cannabinus]